MSGLLLTSSVASILINSALSAATITASASITVDVTRSFNEVAPELITFEVTGFSGFDTAGPSGGETFDERLHDLVYLWSFGDSGATFSIPTRLPSSHTNANIAYGHSVAHKFGPGTYVISCMVWELSSGKTAEWTQSITVADPDVYFASNTIVVDTGGGGDATTLAAGLDAARTAQASGPVRLSLTRGQTFPISSAYSFRYGALRNLYVDATGTGAKPIVDATGASGRIITFIDEVNFTTYSGSGENEIDFVWTDIRFEGPWDAADETGALVDLFYGNTQFDTATTGLPSYIFYNNCEADGFSKFIEIGSRAVCQNAFYSDFNITNWHDYGSRSIGRRNVFIGCKFNQKQTALSGGPKDTQHNNHTCWRGSGKLIIDGCDFFNNTGWTFIGNYRAHQPPIRYVETTDGIRSNIQRSIFEGGFNTLDISPSNNNTDIYSLNCVVEKCYLLGSWQTIRSVELGGGGVTFRNNVFVAPNVPILDNAFGYAAPIRCVVTSLTTGAEWDRVLVEHNQFIYLRSDANGGSTRGYDANGGVIYFTQGGAQPNSIVSRYNLYHEPNTTGGDVPYAPLDTTVLFTPIYDGYRTAMERFAGTFSGEVVNGDFFDLPYANGDIGNADSTYWATGKTHELFVDNAARTFTIAYNTTSFRITNTSGVTWANGAGFEMFINRNPANLPAVNTSVATPSGNAARYYPQTNSTAIGGAATSFPRYDFEGTNRKTIIDGLTRTAASIGAFEPNLES